MLEPPGKTSALLLTFESRARAVGLVTFDIEVVKALGVADESELLWRHVYGHVL
jgi:hypothetical protein